MVYEVNILVDNDAAEQMAAWMTPHIREILQIDGFIGATWYQLDPEGDRQSWSIRYRLDNYAALNNYLENHATRMRDDGLARFGGRFVASRRIMSLRAKFARSQQ